MSPWLLLLLLALVAVVLGFATAAHWLFIAAIVCVVVWAVSAASGGRL